MKGLDKMLQTMLGKGLEMFCPEESDIGRGLVCDPLKLPPTLILHLDQGSPAFCMVVYFGFKVKARFLHFKDIFHRE